MPKIIYYSKDKPLEVNQYVQMLIQALSKVEECYLGYEEIKFFEDKIEKNTIRAERVFAYELYHQFRLLMKEDCEYYLNGEIRKSNKVFNWENQSDCYPDLVLHGNQTFIDKESQYFLCEIKMSTNKSLLDDLSKLSQFCKSNLEFQNYIFLCVGLLKDDLQKEIEKSKINYNKRILCICRKDETIEVFDLDFITSSLELNENIAPMVPS